MCLGTRYREASGARAALLVLVLSVAFACGGSSEGDGTRDAGQGGEAEPSEGGSEQQAGASGRAGGEDGGSAEQGPQKREEPSD
jgi:hypothetical protein